MRDGGPIEAAARDRPRPPGRTFPPLRDGGPIEALERPRSSWCTTTFPPLRDGGPIEAYDQRLALAQGLMISAVERRRPH